MNEATVKLQAPQGASGVSVDGIEYRVDGDFVEVPACTADVLRSHGYVTYVPEVKTSKAARAERSGSI